MMDIIGGLTDVFSNLVFSLVLAGLAVMFYVAVKTFQGPRERNPRDTFGLIRNMLVFAPLIWLILNFNSDSNTIADVMIGTWLPIVLACILVLGLVEIAVYPVWLDSKRKGSRNVGEVIRK